MPNTMTSQCSHTNIAYILQWFRESVSLMLVAVFTCIQQHLVLCMCSLQVMCRCGSGTLPHVMGHSRGLPHVIGDSRGLPHVMHTIGYTWSIFRHPIVISSTELIIVSLAYSWYNKTKTCVYSNVY